MKLNKLFEEFELLGIPKERYYLNGIYGSEVETNTIALVRVVDNCFDICINTENKRDILCSFNDEEDACEFLYKKLKYEWIKENIGEIKGLNGMTFNERLYASGLEFEYQESKIKDPKRADQILRILDII